MKFKWREIGIQVGSIDPNKDPKSPIGPKGGSIFAQKALEIILGDNEIKEMINCILEYEETEEIMISVLRLIKSTKAVEIAYNIYKNSEGQRAYTAVWIIKHIAHPMSLKWVEEFLDDDNVAGWGIGLVDQLAFAGWIDIDMVEEILKKAENHKFEGVRARAISVRDYLKEQED